MPIHSITCFGCDSVESVKNATYDVGMDEYFCVPCAIKVADGEHKREIEKIQKEIERLTGEMNAKIFRHNDRVAALKVRLIKCGSVITEQAT
jgi:hypothetical protein